MKEFNPLSSTNFPAIIIIAHDRPKSIQRLLSSLERAVFPSENIELIISIDKSDNTQVVEIANNFNWLHGNKRILEHSQHLGLKQHVVSCGNLTQEVGTSILLEDDLWVAPHFYSYAVQANEFFKSDNQIAGVSLYAYSVTENGAYPFYPYDDGFDNYFLQIPSSWGQVFTPEQWNSFSTWLNLETESNSIHPNYIEAWGEQSWKKKFIKYLIDSERYFVFPRKSHSTNFEDRGTHANGNGQFQVELQSYSKTYRFSTIFESASKYDAWFELEAELFKRKVPPLSQYDFTVDLYGTKRKENKKKLTLTSKRGDHPILSFGSKMTPLHQNVFFEIEGNTINLLESEQEKDGKIDELLFFPLTTIAEKKIQQIVSNQLQVGIVVPLLQWEEEKLVKLLNSLENQSDQYWTCLLVTPNNNVAEIETILRKAQSSNRVKIIRFQESKDQFSLIEFGFNYLKKQIFYWLPPTAEMSRNEVTEAVQIFKEFKHISYLKQVSYQQILNHRWNAELLHEHIIHQKRKFSTSKTFIANHVWESLDTSFEDGVTLCKEERWALKAILLYPFYIFVNNELDAFHSNPMEKLDKESVQQLIKSLPELPKRKTQLLSALFRSFYQKNIPYLRSFYTLYHNLNDLIRYDEKNKSHYFDRY